MLAGRGSREEKKSGFRSSIKPQFNFSFALPPNLRFLRPDLKVLKGGLKITRLFHWELGKLLTMKLLSWYFGTQYF